MSEEIKIGRFPNENDVVMTEVKSISELGVYVNLLEYGNREGFINISEVFMKKKVPINKVMKIGDKIPLTVQSINKENGQIDLSKRRTREVDAKECEQRYRKSCIILGLLKDLGKKYEEITSETVDDCLFSLNQGDILESPESVIAKLPLNDEQKKDFHVLLKTRIVTRKAQLEATISAYTFQSDGISDIKRVWDEINRMWRNEKFKLEIIMLSPPLYKLTFVQQTDIKDEAELPKMLETVNEFIKDILDILKDNKFEAFLKVAATWKTTMERVLA